MASLKVTFTLDRATIGLLADAAQRLAVPKSEVVRKAIADYHSRIGLLSESERQRKLRILEKLMAQGPTRPQSEVDAELREIREVRRLGGRRHPVD